MAVLMLGVQVAVLMIEVQEPSAAEAVVQNKCSRSSDAVQCSRSRGAEPVMQYKSSRSMDGRILSLLRGSVENM